MKKNATIAMVAALTITTAAGVGAGGYLMGHKVATDTAASTEMSSREVSHEFIAELNNLVNSTKTVSMSDVARQNASTVKSSTTSATNKTNTATNTSNKSNTNNNKTTPEKKKAEPRRFTVTPKDYTVYCTIPDLNVRNAPETATSQIIGGVKEGQALHVTGAVDGYSWLQVDYNGQRAYVSSPYVSTEKPGSKKTDETLVVTLDGVGNIKDGLTEGMTVADAKDALLYVGGVDADGKAIEMQAVETALFKCNSDGSLEALSDNQVLEAGNTYCTKVTVKAKENGGKTVHFSKDVKLSQDLAGTFNINSVNADSVVLISPMHTI